MEELKILEKLEKIWVSVEKSFVFEEKEGKDQYIYTFLDFEDKCIYIGVKIGPKGGVVSYCFIFSKNKIDDKFEIDRVELCFSSHRLRGGIFCINKFNRENIPNSYHLIFNSGSRVNHLFGREYSINFLNLLIYLCSDNSSSLFKEYLKSLKVLNLSESEFTFGILVPMGGMTK